MIRRSTKNQAKGTAKEVSGKIKEKAGRATNNPRLEDKGTGERVTGKVQKKVGQIQRVFEE